MKLSSSEIQKLRTELTKITDNLYQLYDTGLFEIEDISEKQKYDIIAFLKKSSWVKDFNLTKNDDTYFLRGIVEPNTLNEKVTIHNQLNPLLWDKDDELLPEVREKIIQIVDKFKENLKDNDIKLKIKDIYLLGSNANYNYTDNSDLDVHIIADESFDCSDKHLPIIYNAFKKLFNDKYDITINGINVEIYVENADNLSNVATGVYSLNKGWIKRPTIMEIPKIDDVKLDKEVGKWENKYLELVKHPSIDAIDDYIDSIYEIRQSGIKKDGEFSFENQVFKEIRNLGYLDDLRKIKTNLENKELSLEEAFKDKTNQQTGEVLKSLGNDYVLFQYSDGTKAQVAKKDIEEINDNEEDMPSVVCHIFYTPSFRKDIEKEAKKIPEEVDYIGSLDKKNLRNIKSADNVKSGALRQLAYNGLMTAIQNQKVSQESIANNAKTQGKHSVKALKQGKGSGGQGRAYFFVEGNNAYFVRFVIKKQTLNGPRELKAIEDTSNYEINGSEIQLF